MKVVVVDDMLLLREGLARILRDRGIDVVAEAASAEGLPELARRTAADAVILDIRMPPTFTDEGLVAAAELREANPTVAILVLSQVLDATHAMRLLEVTPERVGASGKEHRCSIDAVASLVYPEAPTEFDRLEKARAFAVSQRLTAIENNRHQVEAPSDHVSSPVLTTDVLN